MSPFVIGVDGGNSKTAVLFADLTGRRLAMVRGPGSSPHNIGLAAAIEVVDQLVARARHEAGLPDDARAVRAALCIAGIDLPDEEAAYLETARTTGWAEHVATYNDTHALLHAGTERGWGIAMVVGAGINCVGVSRDGRIAGYPSLGFHTGDTGGGIDLGRLALHHASRAQDLRGPATRLAQLVPAFFGLESPYDVAIAVHRGELPRTALIDLAPLVFDAADEGDAVAASLLAAQADEILVTITSVVRRLDLELTDVTVVLGGGLLAARHPLLLGPVERGILALVPAAEVVVCTEPPVIGAAAIAIASAGSGNDPSVRSRLFAG